MEYLQSIVWLIRAEEDSQPPSEGSAVAIRLVRKGSLGDAGKLYLLTCAHVVRKGRANEKDFGPCYRRIRAWAPGWPFSDIDPQSGVAVRPVPDVFPTTSNSKDFYHRPVHLDGHSDWVILEFEDRSISETFDRPSVSDWRVDNSDDSRICSIIGYPGGSTGFNPPARIVEPTLGFDKVPIKRQEAGLICFEGVQTRPGMSGGGVFDVKTNSLVGLHRSRNDLALDLAAVAASQFAPIISAAFSFLPRQKVVCASDSSAVLDLNEFDKKEVVAIATSLLKTSITQCRTEGRIELRCGSKGKLTLMLTEFASDSMQRLGLQGSLDLSHTQQASITSLQEKEDSGMFPGATFSTQIGRLQVAYANTLDDILSRLRLMIESCVPVT